MDTIKYCNRICTIVLALAISACGGGSGSSGGGSGGSGGSGSGSSGTITSSNAAAFAANILYLADFSDYFDAAGTIITGVVSSEPRHHRTTIGNLINWQIAVVANLPYTTTPTRIYAAGIFPTSSPGNACAGGGNFDITWTDANTNNTVDAGDSASVTFNACSIDTGYDPVDGGLDIDITSITGDPATDSDWTLGADIVFNDLIFTFTGGSETVNATVTLSQSLASGTNFSTNYTGNLDGTGTDTGGSYTYYLHNMDITGTEDSSSGSWTFAANCDGNDSTIGNFTVATISPFAGTGTYPDSGSAKVTAADNSSITLTTITATDVQLDVDTNGDNIIDASVSTTWNFLASL